MASTYSSLKIELIGNGEQSGTWGTTTNLNLGTAIDEAITGRATADFPTDADLTLGYTDSNATQIFRNLILNVTSTGALTVTRNLVVPTIEKQYLIENNTSGGQSIVVKTSAGTGVTVPNGRKAHVYANGTNVVLAFDFVDINGGAIDGTPIGASTPSTGSFTSATIAGGTINDTTIGASTASTGAFTTISATTLGASLNANSQAITNANIDSGTIDGTTVGATTPAAGAFTTISATDDGTFSGTGQVKLPAGTTAERSGSPVEGMLRYNSELDVFEGYDGEWGGIGSGAEAGGAILVNKSAASVSYVIEVGENGLSVGPITVNSSVTVTVSSGQRWLIL